MIIYGVCSESLLIFAGSEFKEVYLLVKGSPKQAD